MTIALLIRHATHDLVERALIGRLPNVPLSAQGLIQARVLAARLTHARFDVLQSSPQLRARQTAQAISEATGRSVEVVAAVDELDAGDWSGRLFSDLEADPQWRQWNATRGTARAPNGESMIEVQQRIVHHIRQVAKAHPHGNVAIVSHAEPIRAAVMYARGVPLNEYTTVRIDPVSVNAIQVGPVGGMAVRDTDDLMAVVDAP